MHPEEASDNPKEEVAVKILGAENANRSLIRGLAMHPDLNQQEADELRFMLHVFKCSQRGCAHVARLRDVVPLELRDDHVGPTYAPQSNRETWLPHSRPGAKRDAWFGWDYLCPEGTTLWAKAALWGGA